MRPTNNKIYDQVNSLINENQRPMNSLAISFPYEYASEAVDLNWCDILFAIDNGYLHHKAAIEHAQVELEEDEYPQAVLDLACIYPEEAVFPHSIHPYIDELANMVEDEKKSKSKDKVMYILLKWVYEHGVDCADPYYDHPFKILTTICDDFGFPESITHFAWYVSEDKAEPDLGSPEKNRARWLGHWKQFLDEQQKLFKVTR